MREIQGLMFWWQTLASMTAGTACHSDFCSERCLNLLKSGLSFHSNTFSVSGVTWSQLYFFFFFLVNHFVFLCVNGLPQQSHFCLLCVFLDSCFKSGVFTWFLLRLWLSSLYLVIRFRPIQMTQNDRLSGCSTYYDHIHMFWGWGHSYVIFRTPLNILQTSMLIVPIVINNFIFNLAFTTWRLMGRQRKDQNIRFILCSIPCFLFVYNIYIFHKQRAHGPMTYGKMESKANTRQVCRVSK